MPKFWITPRYYYKEVLEKKELIARGYSKEEIESILKKQYEEFVRGPDGKWKEYSYGWHGKYMVGREES